MGWSGVWRLPPFPGTAGRNFNYHCNCSGWYPDLCSSGKKDVYKRQNPDIVKENIKKKFQDHKLPLVDEVIELDEQARSAQQEADALRANRNSISKQIGALMGQGKKDEAMALKEQVSKDAARLAELEEQEKDLQEKITRIMMTIPVSYTHLV